LEKVAMKRLVLALWILLWLAGLCWAGQVECASATCRVICFGSMGSGVAITTGTDETIYVLTNRHVVGLVQRKASCEFFRGTPAETKAIGTVAAVSRSYDLATIAIPISQFSKGLPYTIPLALQSPSVGDRVITHGFPHGRGPTAFQSIVKSYSGSTFTFDRAPAGGRSGSGIFDADANYVVGVLSHRGVGWGMGQNLDAIYTFLAWPKTASTIECSDVDAAEEARIFRRYQSPPKQCPPGGCDPPQGEGEGTLPGWGPGLPRPPAELPIPKVPEIPPVPDVPVVPIPDPVPDPDDETIANLEHRIGELIVRIEQLEAKCTGGQQGEKGEKGDKGDRGEKGEPGQDAGPTLAPDIDEITAAVLTRMKPVTVALLDGSGNVHRTIEQDANGVIPLPAPRLRTYTEGGEGFSETTAPLGEPLGLKSKFITRKGE
jgi:hypothetical protein